MKILTIDHAAVNVTDVEVSRKFYTEGLGFEEMERPDFDFAGVWYRVGPASQQFHLISHRDMFNEELPDAKKPRSAHHLAFRVEDTDAVEKELTSRGVEIMLYNKRPDGIAQLFVMDPDGYVIEFNSFNA